MGETESKEAYKKYKNTDTPGPNPWQKDGKFSERLGWHEVEHYLISYVVQSVALAGGSAQFTITSDRGAVGVRIYHDSHKTKTAWYSDLDELQQALFDVGDYYRALAGEEPLRWE